MASTTTDDGFHEIQLNGKQLVFLFMAVTVVSVVIFLCGVLVGRGVRAAQGPEQIVPGESASVEVPEPPPLPPTADNATPTTAKETLTYDARLSAAAPPREELTPAPPPVREPATTPGPAASASAATGPPAPTAAPPAAAPASGLWTIQVAALRQRAEADGIVARLAGKGYDAYVLPPEASQPAVFRVRVGRFKERREAESVADRLLKEEKFKPWIIR